MGFVQLGKIDGVKKLADSIQNSRSHFVEVPDLDKRVEYSAVAKRPKVKGGRLESAPPQQVPRHQHLVIEDED